MRSRPEFMILSGDGINCERETRLAFEEASAKGTIVHINDLLANPSILRRVQGMAIPGGFSFGDELGSGQVLALKIKHELYQEFFNFVDSRRPIIGICNGFQVLAKLGLLPCHKESRSLALAPNLSGRFTDHWVDIEVVSESVCVWTSDMPSTISLPVRHGEGRVMFPIGMEDQVLRKLESKGQIPLRYREDLNGSYGRIAGLCDPSGTILGLMPHPEAALFSATAPIHHRNFETPTVGMALFKNVVNYLNMA